MANSKTSGFSDSAVRGYPPPSYHEGNAPQQLGVNPILPGQGGANPPPYILQPQCDQYVGAPVMAPTQLLGERGPPPDTSCSLLLSILSIFFCLWAWPFAVVAIIFNRKAKSQVDMGLYTTAKNTLRTCFVFLGITIILGIIAWVIFVIRLHAALYDDPHEKPYYGYG